MISPRRQGKDFWRQRKVFITGCTGLLGSWLTRRLIELGAEVVGLIRDGTPQSNFFLLGLQEKVTIVRGEIENRFLLDRTLNEYEIDSVFHLAAQTQVGIANASPFSTFETNIKGTWNLLESCRQNSNISRIVVASSDKAYGIQEKLPYEVDAPLQGTFPYDVSKSCADLIALSYWHTHGLPVGVTRCGNLFGGGDLNFRRIVPGTILSVLLGKPPVIRSDGKATRDYIYVLDAVDAYLLLAERIDEIGDDARAFNFSQEQPLSVLAITETVLRLMNRAELTPIVKNQTKGEIPHQYLSAKEARNQLGWKPQFSLEQGLLDTIGWYRDYMQDKIGEA
jgi:CDP-glucose 4,6-dehydratase